MSVVFLFTCYASTTARGRCLYNYPGNHL